MLLFFNMEEAKPLSAEEFFDVNYNQHNVQSLIQLPYVDVTTGTEYPNYQHQRCDHRRVQVTSAARQAQPPTLASVDHTTKALHFASFFRLTEAGMSRTETGCSPQSLMRTSRIPSSLICSTLSASCGCVKWEVLIGFCLFVIRTQ